jgi:large subunit ribosomal protein L30
MKKKIKVTRIRSVIGQSFNVKKIIESLGLKKINSVKIFNNNNSIRGSLRKVQHMINIEMF